MSRAPIQPTGYNARGRKQRRSHEECTVRLLLNRLAAGSLTGRGAKHRITAAA